MAWGIFGATVAVAYLMPDGTIQALDARGQPIPDCQGPARAMVGRVLSRSTSATRFLRVRESGRQCDRWAWEFELECLSG